MADAFEKGLIVSVLVENLLLPVAAIEDVITDAANRGSWCARHVHIVVPTKKESNNKGACPEWHCRAFWLCVGANGGRSHASVR
jgi:hypothetical protein